MNKATCDVCGKEFEVPNDYKAPESEWVGEFPHGGWCKSEPEACEPCQKLWDKHGFSKAIEIARGETNDN